MGHIVLGIGGTGQKVLTHLKHLLPESVRTKVFLLSLDTVSKSNIDNYEVAGTRLDYDNNREYFHIADERKMLIGLRGGTLRDDEASLFKQNFRFEEYRFRADLVSDEDLRIEKGAGMHRQISAAGVLINSLDIVAKLKEFARKLPPGRITIWVVGSLAGGTGGGSLLPLGALARLAMQDQADANVRAIVVLTESYRYAKGVSKGRGFALLRELDYAREVGAEKMDRLFEQPRQGRPFHERFEFKGSPLARVGTLFDSYSYVDRPCASKEETASLLQEVGNALRLFIDEAASAEIDQALANASAANARLGIFTPVPTYGLHEILVPADDIARLFALEKARDLVWKIAQPNDELTGLRGLRGEGEGPAKGAISEIFPSMATVENLSPKPALPPEVDAVRKFKEDSMYRADGVVRRLFNVSALVERGLSEDGKRAFQLATADLSHDVLTVEEKRKAKKQLRSPDDEKRDFKKEIDDARKRHLGATRDGGNASEPRSFSAARQAILHELRKIVEERIGRRFIERELGGSWKGHDTSRLRRTIQATDEVNTLAEEFAGVVRSLAALEMAGTAGLQSLERRRTEADARLREAEAKLEQATVERRLLRLDWSDLDTRQQQYRRASNEFVDACRAEWLVETFVQVLEIVRDVAGQWRQQLQDVAERLVHKPSDKGLLNQLKKRLDAASQHLEERTRLTTASIGLGRSIDLDGYRAELLREFQQTFAVPPDEWLDDAKWVLPVDEQGNPTGERRPLLRLPKLPGHGSGPLEPGEAVRTIEEILWKQADGFLETKSIWDYLAFWVKQNGGEWQAVGRHLRTKNKLLLDGAMKDNEDHKPRLVLLYNNRGLKEGIQWADAVREGVMAAQPGLRQLVPEDLGTVTGYPNRWAMGLFQSVGFDAEDVPAFRDMRQEYLQEQKLPNTDANWMPYTYHTLRGLQVAFDIEREAYHRDSTTFPQPQDLLHPLVARGLREPHYAWYFFRLLALGAIDRTPKDEWRIKEYDERGDLLLTNERDGNLRGDLVLAMSRFCVQQREQEDRDRRLSAAGLRARYEKALEHASITPSSDGEKTRLAQFAAGLDSWLTADDNGVIVDRSRRRPDVIRKSLARAGQYMLRTEERLVRG